MCFGNSEAVWIVKLLSSKFSAITDGLFACGGRMRRPCPESVINDCAIESFLDWGVLVSGTFKRGDNVISFVGYNIKRKKCNKM